MKVLGLIGGTGWPSTRDYYELLNQTMQQRKGGLSGVELRLWSFDFQHLLEQTNGDPIALAAAFTKAGEALIGCGAQVLALSSATGHLYADDLQKFPIPFVSLSYGCAQELARLKVDRVLILGTQRAINGGVFDAPLTAVGIEIIAPPVLLQEALDIAIFEELELAAPAEKFALAIRNISAFCKLHSVKHVLLGCTELRPHQFSNADFDSSINFHDSTKIHVKQLVEFLDANQ
jgi:aspartate racemase